MKKNLKSILFITVAMLLLVTGLNFLNLKFLFSFHNYINDKAFTLRDKNEADTNIVLVNMATLNRTELAKLINKVSEAEPKVIGLHFCLDKETKTSHDSLLANTLNQSKNIVLLSDQGKNCNFLQNKKIYPLALVKDEDEVIRSFSSSPTPYFETEIVKQFDNAKYQKLLKQDQVSEQINYIGNISHYTALNHDQVLTNNFEKDVFKNKIVLIGFLGNSISTEVNSIEASVYTPLNDKLQNNKTLPDMYSMVASANAISTILDESYIEEVPIFISVLIILCIVIFNLLIASILIESSMSTFLLFMITSITTEIFLSGLLIVWLLNDYQKMLYLKELPVAIGLSFVLFLGIYLKYKNTTISIEAVEEEQEAVY